MNAKPGRAGITSDWRFGAICSDLFRVGTVYMGRGFRYPICYPVALMS